MPPWKFHFLEKVEIEIGLGSNKISLGEKNYKNINGYLYNDYKVKSLHIMLRKTRAYLKSYDWQTKWMYFKLSGWKWLLNRKM